MGGGPGGVGGIHRGLYLKKGGRGKETCCKNPSGHQGGGGKNWRKKYKTENRGGAEGAVICRRGGGQQRWSLATVIWHEHSKCSFEGENRRYVGDSGPGIHGQEKTTTTDSLSGGCQGGCFEIGVREGHLAQAR